MENNTTILVAEDREFSEACRVIFGFHGFTVVTCERDGREIVARCAEISPAFVLANAETEALIDMLRTLRGVDCAPTVIVISGTDSPRAEHEALTAGAAYYLVRPVSIQTIAERMAAFVRAGQASSDERHQVTEMLRKIGVPAHIRGYRYLRQAVLLAIEDDEIIHQLTGRMYPEIAASNSATASGVERAMRHAVEVAWTRGDIDVLDEYFGGTVSPSKGKPTNGEFIALLADRVKLSAY